MGVGTTFTVTLPLTTSSGKNEVGVEWSIH
jgi:hypothetical protein